MTASSDDEAVTALALSAARGNERALEAFIKATQHDVWRFVTYLSDAGSADDLTQETFLRAIGAIERFEGRSSARTWLLAIARRVVADHIRHAQSRPRTAAVYSEQLLHGGRHSRGFEDLVEVTTMIAGLNTEQREALLLTQLLGLPVRRRGSGVWLPGGHHPIPRRPRPRCAAGRCGTRRPDRLAESGDPVGGLLHRAHRRHPVRERRARHHHHRNTKRRSGIQLRPGHVAAAVLGDQRLDAMLGQQLQFVVVAIRPAGQHQLVTTRQSATVRLGDRADQKPRVAIRERPDTGAARGEKDPRIALFCNGFSRFGVRCDDDGRPRIPRRASQHQMR